MNLAPYISFVLPAYKSAYLKQAVSSILSQTEKNIELIIVDDCSPENLPEILEQFQDSRLSYFRNPENIGGADLVRQWNHCLSFAKGEWVVLAADDDVYDERFAAECHNLVRKYPDVDLVRSRVRQIDENGGHLWDDGEFKEYSNKYQYLNDWLTGKAFTCIGNFAFRREVLLSIGGFMDFPCAFGSDIATPIALSAHGVANTGDMLFSFRQSTLHLSSDSSRFVEKLHGISKLSFWLSDLKYDVPENESDKELYSICTEDYLHKKCVYDYFNLVIRYLPLKKLGYIKYCVRATPADKAVMVLRWIKQRLRH